MVIPYIFLKPSIELIEKPEDNQTQLSAIKKIIGKETSHAYIHQPASSQNTTSFCKKEIQGYIISVMPFLFSVDCTEPDPKPSLLYPIKI